MKRLLPLILFLGVTGTTFAVTPTPAPAITIVDNAAASPYPSTITRSGLGGTITNITVTLIGLTHTWVSDVDVLLVGPAGQKVVIFSDVGDGFNAGNVTVTLSDAAASSLPTVGSFVSGTYKPTDYTTAPADTFPAPAPSGPYGTLLSAFNGTNANGVWSLYVFDDGPGDFGSFAGGWNLTITTSGGATPTPSPVPVPTASPSASPTPTASPAPTPVAWTGPYIIPYGNIIASGGNATLTLSVNPAAVIPTHSSALLLFQKQRPVGLGPSYTLTSVKNNANVDLTALPNTPAADGLGNQLYGYYLADVSAITSVTITFSGRTTCYAVLYIIANTNYASPIDTVVINNGAGTSMASGSITTTAARELVIGAFGLATGNSVDLATGETQFSALNIVPVNFAYNTDVQLFTTNCFATNPVPYNAQARVIARDRTSGPWAAFAVAIRVAPGATPSPTPTPSPTVAPTGTPPGGSDPLPLVRRPGGVATGWTDYAGVPGGIPTRLTVSGTPIPTSASAATIEAAINACPANQTKSLAAGTFNNVSGGTITITNNNVTLRGAVDGAGRATTIFPNVNFISIGDYATTWYCDEQSVPCTPKILNKVNVTSGYTQGSTALTLSSASGYSIGQFIILDQLNECTEGLPNCDVNPYGSNCGEGNCWACSGSPTTNCTSGYPYMTIARPGDGADRGQHQMAKITAINGNVVTMSEPVYMPNYNATYIPQAWHFAFTPIAGVGVENISCPSNSLLRFHGAYGSWFYNCTVRNDPVAVQHTGYLAAYWSVRCSIKKCFVGINSGGYSASDPYGIEERSCSGLLVEDNTVDGAGALQYSGCSASVFAYNFVPRIFSGGGGYMAAGMFNHTGWPYMCLLEGNVTCEWQMDTTWGSSGYLTGLRNYFTGIEQPEPLYPNGRLLGNNQAVFITGRHHTFLGNVLGAAGVTFNAFDDGPSCSLGNLEKRIYSTGFWRPECAYYDNATNSTRATLIRGQNWDQYNQTIITGGYATNDIPNSYYLASKPAWFGSLSWPPISPTNVAQSRNPDSIPAGYRYSHAGQDPPITRPTNATTPTDRRPLVFHLWP